MDEKKVFSKEEQRVRMAEEIWLDYFNRTLFEQGLITESARNKMVRMICEREKHHRKNEQKKTERER